MKKSIVSQLLLLFCISSFSQNTGFQLPARQTPTVKKEALSRVIYLNDLSPLLWSSMQLPLKGDYWLTQRRVNNYNQPQPLDYLYPQDEYKKILEVIYLKIMAVCNSKTVVAVNNTDKLSAQQKSILSSADLSSNINVTIKYRYKDQTNDSWGSRNNVIEGETVLAIIPDKEAEYPGGWKQLSEYFNASVIKRIDEPKMSDKIYQAIVKFIVNEEGQIVNAEITRTSSNKHIDQLLLKAVNQMPKWRPAENAKGLRIKQEIIIPFGSGC